MLYRIYAAVCVCVALSSSASAQVVVELSSEDGGTNTLYAKDGMVRMDATTGGDDMSTIFRGEEFLVINHGSRTYSVLDREQLVEISDQMNSALKEMQEQLANLPPQQRAMVERMMGDRLAQLAPPPEPLRVEREGAGQQGRYSCTEYTVYRGDERRFEICAASVDDLGPGAAEAMEAFRGMAAFTEELLQTFRQGPFAGVIDNPYQVMSEIEGFPVRTRDFDDGRVRSEITLQSITQQAIADEQFSPPDGYRREEIQGLSR